MKQDIEASFQSARGGVDLSRTSEENLQHTEELRVFGVTEATRGDQSPSAVH